MNNFKGSYPSVKVPKTYKGKMEALREILSDNQTYPPSSVVWQQILELATERTPEQNIASVQARMRREADRYKPALPEPQLARFYHHGMFYYLDARQNIYKHDDGNALVGNLVGLIKEAVDPVSAQTSWDVIINKEVVMSIPKLNVKEMDLYHRTYYVDDQKSTYRGLHPQLKFIHLIGKLTDENKIILTKD